MGPDLPKFAKILASTFLPKTSYAWKIELSIYGMLGIFLQLTATYGKNDNDKSFWIK